MGTLTYFQQGGIYKYTLKCQGAGGCSLELSGNVVDDDHGRIRTFKNWYRHTQSVNFNPVCTSCRNCPIKHAKTLHTILASHGIFEIKGIADTGNLSTISGNAAVHPAHTIETRCTVEKGLRS